jgi:hypothetical protein
VTEVKGITETIESVDTAESQPPETSASEVVTDGTSDGEFEPLTKPFKIRKRIGSTTYDVEVRFSPACRETLEDKILRLIRNEAGREQTREQT